MTLNLQSPIDAPQRRRSEKLNATRNNFSLVMLAAIGLGLEFAIPQTPFNINLPPFFEVLVARERELPDNHNPVPFGPLLPLSLPVKIGLVRGNREINDGQAGRCVTDFRVLP
jgi:hypothetical protein